MPSIRLGQTTGPRRSLDKTDASILTCTWAGGQSPTAVSIYAKSKRITTCTYGSKHHIVLTIPVPQSMLWVETMYSQSELRAKATCAYTSMHNWIHIDQLCAAVQSCGQRPWAQSQLRANAMCTTAAVNKDYLPRHAHACMTCMRPVDVHGSAPTTCSKGTDTSEQKTSETTAC